MFNGNGGRSIIQMKKKYIFGLVVVVVIFWYFVYFFHTTKGIHRSQAPVSLAHTCITTGEKKICSSFSICSRMCIQCIGQRSGHKKQNHQSSNGSASIVDFKQKKKVGPKPSSSKFSSIGLTWSLMIMNTCCWTTSVFTSPVNIDQ